MQPASSPRASGLRRKGKPRDASALPEDSALAAQRDSRKRVRFSGRDHLCLSEQGGALGTLPGAPRLEASRLFARFGAVQLATPPCHLSLKPPFPEQHTQPLLQPPHQLRQQQPQQKQQQQHCTDKEFLSRGTRNFPDARVAMPVGASSSSTGADKSDPSASLAEGSGAATGSTEPSSSSLATDYSTTAGPCVLGGPAAGGALSPVPGLPSHSSPGAPSAPEKQGGEEGEGQRQMSAEGGGAPRKGGLGLQAQSQPEGVRTQLGRVGRGAEEGAEQGKVKKEKEEGEEEEEEEDEEEVEVRVVTVEELVGLMPQMRLERSHSEIEILVKRRQLLGTYMGTPKAGASPQLPRTRSF